MKKRIFIICSVRDADIELQERLAAYVDKLEAEGNEVHYPRRDTDQTMRGIDICRYNASKIAVCDEVHIWYVAESQGSHFDMGVAFILNKPLVIIHNAPLLPDGKKCFQRMLTEWEEERPGLVYDWIRNSHTNISDQKN